MLISEWTPVLVSIELPKTKSFLLLAVNCSTGDCDLVRSDHWQCLSVTHSLTHSLTECRLVNLIDVTLACEDVDSKLVEVVTVADVDSHDHVGNSLLQIWELTFGPKANLLFRL